MNAWIEVGGLAQKARILGGVAVLLAAMTLSACGGSDDVWGDAMNYLALAGADEWLDAESQDSTVHDHQPQ